MAERTSSRPPPPIVQAFLLCREIFQNERTRESILVGPTCHVPVTEFPVNIRLSLFVQLTEGRGRYRLAMSLRDADDEEVWRWEPGTPLEHPDPLLPHQLTFHDLVLTVPRVGRYHFVLLANDEEIVQQAIFIGPTEAFRE